MTPSAPLVERLPAATITEKGPVLARVVGTWLKKDAVSLNNRLYPAETVDRVVAKAQARIADPRALPIQVLDRHATADSDDSLKVVGKVTKVWIDGDDAKYEAEIPNTSAGRDYANLVQGGFVNAVSLRADPGTAQMEPGRVGERSVDVIRDFDLGGIDATLYPGIRDAARIESIQVFESVDPAAVTATLSESLAGPAAVARAWYETAVAVAEKFQQPGHYTAKDREKIPADDFAGPDQTFPIVTQQDVHDAARLIGHAGNPDAVKRRVIAIAKRKGFALPDAWKNEKESGDMSLLAMLRECDLTPAQLAKAKTLASACDDKIDALIQVIGAVDHDKESVPGRDLLGEAARTLVRVASPPALPPESAPRRARLLEYGKTISAKTMSSLSQAHDHIATVLGMECAPQAHQEETESVTPEQIQRMIDEAVTKALKGSGATETKAPATAESVKETASESALSVIATAIARLGENQATIEKKIADLGTTVENAVKENWRPERKTVLAENADAGKAQQADKPAVREAIKDRSVPVETRFKLAADALTGSLKERQAVEALETLFGASSEK